jgi:hypothetical protein
MTYDLLFSFFDGNKQKKCNERSSQQKGEQLISERELEMGRRE